ncbi:DET1 homolog isoform X2 [Euwallacea fornicatus]|uniref:DET1 homolog isoform X2 n=1 Tax=Euwallacea fornicatus TaxID=995702 RepID=UPI00338FDD6C
MESILESCAPKKFPENIVLRLIDRERQCNRRPGTIRQFYQTVYPNFTVINAEKPPCFIRKFTPDGKFAIAFSSDQSSLEVYRYKGPAAAADLLQRIGDLEKPDKTVVDDIKKKIFYRFFELKHSINITTTEQLNRECSLFSDDGRYVIVGSASYIPDEIRPHFYEIYTNNEAVTPTMRWHVCGLYPNERAFKDSSINSLKHRLLTFLHKRASYISSTTKDPTEVRKFFHYFENFKSLRMWKMQLLDENHLLVKYASEEVVSMKQTDANSSDPKFFVVYNITESRVLAVYENSSAELANLYENFTDNFRNACLHSETQFTCSPSNNTYARLHYRRYRHTIMAAKFGGKAEAIRRILAYLPISAQSYTTSPYLDYSLFSYDDKWISLMERPKQCGEHPIRFNSRGSGYLKFRLYVDNHKNVGSTARRLVAFTFHPTDPFAVSVQRTNSEYIVNFHVRCDNQNPDFNRSDVNQYSCL